MATGKSRLAAARKAAGYTQEQLAERLDVSRVTIYRWEKGETEPLPHQRPNLARALVISDMELADVLSDPYGGRGQSVGPNRPLTPQRMPMEHDMKRRALAALGIAATSEIGARVPLLALEALRHELLGDVNGNAGSISEWEALAWGYAHTYSLTAPSIILEDLWVDLSLARLHLKKLSGSLARRSMYRVIAQLAVFLADTFGNLGNVHSASRWWGTARRFSDASGDGELRVWVRGREVIAGIYDRRPFGDLLLVAEEAKAIQGSSAPGMGIGSALMGRAQILALQGKEKDARAATDLVRTMAERLPDRIVGDVKTMYGWPEYRLRYGESFVFTRLQDDVQAEVAYGRAIEIYPDEMFRERAQVSLHRAIRLVRSGREDEGVECALATIQALPEAHRTDTLLMIGKWVANALRKPTERSNELNLIINGSVG